MKQIAIALTVATTFLATAACGHKQDERPEFGGKSPQVFFAAFDAKAVDCDKPNPKLTYQRLNYNGRDYFDYKNGDELDVYLYLLNGKFRLEFVRTHYNMGGRNTVFSNTSHDTESLTGTALVQGNRLLLINNRELVGHFGDGTPIDGKETMSGTLSTIIPTMVKMDVSVALDVPVRVILKTDDMPDQSTISQACGGHMADAVKVH